MTPPTAWAPYCGVAPTPAEIWSRWNLDPVPAAVLLLCALAAARLEPKARALVLAGIAVLSVIFISPLCALSSALFSARTLHHLLLLTVAAPLFAWALPAPRRGGLALATLAQAIVFWSWHAPEAYALALSNDAAYWAMQASFLGSAAWFWRAVKAASCPGAVSVLLATMMQMGLLGALITFAARPLYAPHFLTTVAWGLSPLQDQQAAGLTMWVPAAAAYLFFALAVLSRTLAPADAARPA